MSLNSKSIVQRYAKERRFDESDTTLLARLLTVRFNDCNLSKIGDLSELVNLVKLYLRNNKISSIANISTAPELTHLYVINNCISELNTITRLTKLEKLYAGGNNIQIVEGLVNLENLLELHIEHQKFQPGEKMHIEPESLHALQWLQVLNISNNGIDNLDFIANLRELRCLKCADNKVAELIDLENLRGCLRLNDVTLEGNPVSKKPKYRDHIILNVDEIQSLDAKAINPNEKDFVRKWNAHKKSVTRENTKVVEKEQDSQKYDHSHISHLASGLPSGINNVVRLIRKRAEVKGAQPSPSAPVVPVASMQNQQLLHQTMSSRLAAENERASSVLESNKNAERSETGGGETQSILPPSVQILPHINNTIEGVVEKPNVIDVNSNGLPHSS